MSVLVPTFSQIKAQVAAIQEKAPDARVIGIQAPERWTGERLQRSDDRTYAILQCDSPLAMRFALREPVDDATTKVLITSVDEKDLGDDLRMRLAKGRLFAIKPWQIVATLFDAHAIDPRLSAQPWIAEDLVEQMPAEGYAPARGGFLDADAVWPLLLRRTLGLDAAVLDLESLLEWSLDAQNVLRFRGASPSFRRGANAWLAENVGAAAAFLATTIERLERPDAVPVGVAAGVVFHPSAAGKLDKALGKFEERYLGGQTPDPDVLRRWNAAASSMLRRLRGTGDKRFRQIAQRADEILEEIQAGAFAHLSDVSVRGFDQRMAEFGRRLKEWIATRAPAASHALSDSFASLQAHDRGSNENRRLERARMALRLVRWLDARDEAPAASFADAAERQLREGAFADWARLSVWRGDDERVLSEAYSRLFDEAFAIREQESRRFAELLVDWTATGSKGDDVLPVETILAKLVAPLAVKRDVLVVLIDGMSSAVFRELVGSLTGHEWTSICESGRDAVRPGIATLPSVTAYSRTSLFCGELRQGQSSDEQSGFSAHPSLVPLCRRNAPPTLFHKASLQENDDSLLAKDVRETIQSSHRRIVGVVINAVDDHLLKGSQIDVEWSRDQIRALPALLHEARLARRLVVLLSDHGHVAECRTQQLDGDAGERYRTAGGSPPADGELLISGDRVLTGDGRMIAPWSERVRYSMKKNGYHGGLNPQEIVIPIVVLSSTDDFPDGWRELPPDAPAWWDESRIAAASPLPAPTALKPIETKSAQSPSPGTLFDAEDAGSAAATVEPISSPQWVVHLLASPVYGEQRRLGGRGLPSDEAIAALLAELDLRGGKSTSTALARAVGYPTVRLPGFLAKVERVLNVDGYDILRRDDASDSVELNRGLLLKQFELV